MSGEVDVAPVLDASRVRPVIARVEPGNTLTFHDLDGSAVVRHPFGFDEPARSSTPIDHDLIDVVMVPGLVFDRRGTRIGHGAGMYDRFLAACDPGVVTIGIGPDALVVDELPFEPHDRRVDWIATESGIRLTDRDLPDRSREVIDRAIEVGVAPAMVRFPEGTKTSVDAARAVDAELGAIAKSLVFLVDERPVLVICSGDHRVDQDRLAAWFGGEAARPAPLETVRDVTGFVAGGTPAVGHATPLEVIADVTLCRYRWVWSAGGTPDTVYPVSLERLVAASGARWADVAERG